MGSWRRTRRNVIRATGKGGQLKVGNELAAQVGEWRLNSRPVFGVSMSIMAAVQVVNQHWIRGNTFTLVLELERYTWTWKRAKLSIDTTRGLLDGTLEGKPTIEKRRT